MLVHAFAYTEAFTPADVATRIGLMNTPDFWVGVAEAELHFVLSVGWPEFSEESRRGIEQRILTGPPPEVFEASGSQAEMAREWMIIKLLDSIRRSGGDLTPETDGALERLLARSPWVAALEESMGLEGSPHPAEFANPGALLNNELEQAALLERLRQTEEGDTALTRGLFQLLSVAGEGLDSELSSFILDLPCGAWTAGLDTAVAQWLWRRGSETAEISQVPDFVFSVWDRAAEAILGDDSSDGHPNTYDRACNSRGGALALSLCTWVGRRKWQSGESFGTNLRFRLDRMAAAPGSTGVNGRIVLVRYLAFLHYVDPEWTEKALIGRLGPNDQEAPLLWAARAGKRLGAARLFNQLKPGFLAAIGRTTAKRNDAVELARNLLRLAMLRVDSQGIPYDFTLHEAKQAFRTAPMIVRHAVASELWRAVVNPDVAPQERARRWRDRVGPAFEFLWPLDAIVRDAQTSKSLAWAALACDSAFPDALAKMSDQITPFELPSVEGSLLPLKYGRDLVTRFPDEFLTLLHRSIGLKPPYVPRDLAAMLDLLEPKLSADADWTAFRRLRRLQE